ncbi:MAG: circularly permuted type 2 ATP-grasp protein [Hungatella sp.]|nr:circularly permuted type 2 ATP-grasp protein [Hungatella sp.]
MFELVDHTENINRLLARYGVKFGIYKDQEFHEQLFPFDPLPRVIGAEEFDFLNRGLSQRVRALNLFLADVYSEKKIIKDGVIPADFVYSSKGYLPQCEGLMPPGKIYSHISGIDLVQGKDKNWYILEDNLRIPSGASYPMIARELTRRAAPSTFSRTHIMDNRSYAAMLKETLDYVNTGGINVVLTPGRYNAAFFEHSYLAERSGAVLSMPQDLFVEDNHLYYRQYGGRKLRVGAVYRRLSDEYLDPLCFLPESLIGVPGIMDVYRSGNVAIVNAPGNGVADDKGIYYFVPHMINYYLHEEAILRNAPTYLAFYEKDRRWILENLDRLVVKDVSEAGGYGVIFGSDLTKEKLKELEEVIRGEPRRFIAQEVIDFIDLGIVEGDHEVLRKADLRAFVLSGKETRVWPSGLTRFSRNPDSFVVNSSQGGGFKDTWVLSR